MEIYRRENKTDVRVAPDEYAVANALRFRSQQVHVARRDATRAVVIAGLRSADRSRSNAILVDESLLEISNLAAQANQSGRRCQE
jgi:hypothetical protein